MNDGDKKNPENGCLVLERKDGEAVWIDNRIRVMAYKHRRNGDRFKMVIEAPRDVDIVREEILGKRDNFKKFNGGKSNDDL